MNSAFSAERPEMGIREISRRTGLPKSTTHRLVSELVEWGALKRGGESGDEYMYRVGPSIFGLVINEFRDRYGMPPRLQ